MPPKKSKKTEPTEDDDEFMGYAEPEEDEEKSDAEDDDDVSTVDSDLASNSMADDDVPEEESENEEEYAEDEEQNATKSDNEDDGVQLTGKKLRISEYDDTMLPDEEEPIDEDEDEYYQKLRGQSKIIQDAYHPELAAHSMDEVRVLSMVVRDKNGIIIDANHQTLPFLTKYEKARILGERTQQLEKGAPTFLTELDTRIINSGLIAKMELEQRRIPFIIQRPLPNGKCEFWPLKDLELL